jgi:hypothetical protein
MTLSGYFTDLSYRKTTKMIYEEYGTILSQKEDLIGKLKKLENKCKKK